MKLKAEAFKAKDAIDGNDSFFIIYSIDGDDVSYNCLPVDVCDIETMIQQSKDGECVRWTDFPNSPRRADMVEPELIETFYLDVE